MKKIITDIAHFFYMPLLYFMIESNIMIVTVSDGIVTIVLRSGRNWPLLYLCELASHIYERKDYKCHLF